MDLLQSNFGGINNTTHVAFAYESSQGYFEMAIAKSECEIVDRDSTVECLAQYLLEQQGQRTNAKHLKVIAYEGVGKGAIVESEI